MKSCIFWGNISLIWLIWFIVCQNCVVLVSNIRKCIIRVTTLSRNSTNLWDENYIFRIIGKTRGITMWTTVFTFTPPRAIKNREYNSFKRLLIELIQFLKNIRSTLINLLIISYIFVSMIVIPPAYGCKQLKVMTMMSWPPRNNDPFFTTSSIKLYN